MAIKYFKKNIESSEFYKKIIILQVEIRTRTDGAGWDITRRIRDMSKIVENIITQKDEGYEHYGSVQVSVRDTETDEVRTASVDFCPSKDVGEATAEAIQDASNKF